MSLDDYKSEKIEALMSLTDRCECGRKHSCGLRSFYITDDGSEELVSEIVRQYGAQKIHFISAAEDMPLIGDRVFSRLCSEGHRVSSSVFPAGYDPVCDHVAAGDLLIHVPDGTQLMIAAGGKTICDLAKFTASRSGVPLIFLPSSASSDTFSMSEAEFTENESRRRLRMPSPEVIVADIRALREAPLEKTGAGMACVAADLISLADWKLSSFMTGSAICDTLHDTLLGMCRDILKQTENGTSPRDEDLMRDLITCLTAGGITADMAGTEAPIRGSESAIARHAEAILVSEGINDISFEVLRGASAVYCAKLLEYLRRADVSFDTAREEFSGIDRIYLHKELIRVFGETEGHRILSSLGGANFYQHESRFRRLDRLQQNWTELTGSLRSGILSSGRTAAILRSVSVPSSFRELDLTEEETADILVWGKELSPNYGIVRMLSDLLLLERAVSECCFS